MKEKLLLALFGMLLWLPGWAQFGLNDSSAVLFPLNVGYSFQSPFGDMGNRFGTNHSISFGPAVKLRSNYTFGLQGAFLVSSNVEETGLLRNVIDDEGQILNTEGDPATVLIQQRGYTIMAYAGRIINTVGRNPNSGIMLRLGGGYMRHKIRIETQNDVVPQLEGDNLEGYDRLAGGPAAYFYLGYRHFSNSRLVNFHGGFEIIQGFTEPLRAFNFDTGRAETGTRRDGLIGFRVAWTIPIYRDKPEKVFFY